MDRRRLVRTRNQLLVFIKETEYRIRFVKYQGQRYIRVVASILIIWTGDGSAYQVAQKQPMKLAAMEGLYEGGNGVGLVGIGILNPAKRVIWITRTHLFLYD